MKHQLDFGRINIINNNIAEIVINKDVDLSIEMMEQCEKIYSECFTGNFGLLVNKINGYRYMYETMLTVGSNTKMKAIAIVNYNNEGLTQSNRIIKLREMDELNIKNFSGLELGWQQAFDWLNKELSGIS